MSPFSTSKPFPAPRRPERRRRFHLESLEGRIALSTVGGHPDAQNDVVPPPVSNPGTIHAGVEEAARAEATSQQRYGVNDVRIQNLLGFPLEVTAYLVGTGGRIMRRIPAKQDRRPGPIELFQFRERESKFITIDIRRQGAGDPPPTYNAYLFKPRSDGYHGYLYKISRGLDGKFTVSQPPNSARTDTEGPSGDPPPGVGRADTTP
jgi:hypothetical protein